MGGKRERIQNPKAFLTDDATTVVSKKRSKAPKRHQDNEQMISGNMSSKILREALVQQKEIEEEENQRDTLGFADVIDKPTAAEDGDEDDIDNFAGFSDTQSQFGGGNEQIEEEDEKLLEAFFSKAPSSQRTLADVIAARIREKDNSVSTEPRQVPKLDNGIIELYKGVGKALSAYTSGKIPKAFKHIPATEYWEEVLHITEPDKWSPNAMFQATRIFASNMGAKKAERFYKLVLLPRVRADIRKNKRLHFALYQSLKKALYKPSAFNKGILFPLCESGSCNLREAVIFGSIIAKSSIPPLHSSVALLKLAEMDYYGTTSYFIKLLIEKKYSLPYRVLDALVAHFMRFLDDERTMPVIWHQTLLAFIQRYKHNLLPDDKANLRKLMSKQHHYQVTPEILREVNSSRNRGEKEDDPMLMNILFLCNYYRNYVSARRTFSTSLTRSSACRSNFFFLFQETSTDSAIFFSLTTITFSNLGYQQDHRRGQVRYPGGADGRGLALWPCELDFKVSPRSSSACKCQRSVVESGVACVMVNRSGR